MTAEGEALLRTPIRELLGLLDPAMFKQVHRSTIVNLKAIASIARDDSGRGTIRLKQRPETLAVSQPFMALFRNRSEEHTSDQSLMRISYAVFCLKKKKIQKHLQAHTSQAQRTNITINNNIS